MKLKNLPKRKILAAVALAFVAGIIVAVAWLGNTQSGLQLAVNSVQRFVPGLTIDKAEGKLLKSFTLYGIAFTSEQIALKLDVASMDWQWSALLQEEFLVNRLQVRNGELTIAKNENVQEKDPTPRLSIEELLDSIRSPLKIRVQQLSLHNFVILQKEAEQKEAQQKEDTLLEIHSTRLVRFVWDESISVKRLEFNSSIVNASGSLLISQKRPYNISGDIAIDYFTEALAEINSHVSVEGSTRDAQVKVSVAAPYNLALNIDLSRPMFDRPNMNVLLHWNQLDLAQIRAGLPDLIFDGELRGEGNFLQFEYSINNVFKLDGETPSSTQNGLIYGAKLQVSGDFDQKVLTLKQGSVNFPDSGDVDFSGELDLAAPTIQYHLKGGWKNLSQVFKLTKSREELLNAGSSINTIDPSEKIKLSSQGEFKIDGDFRQIVVDAQSKLIASKQSAIDATTEEVEKNGDVILHASADSLDDIEQLTWSFDLNWQNVMIPWQERILLPEGEVNARGEGMRYEFSSNSNLSIPEKMQAKISLEGSGDQTQATLKTFNIESDAGVVNGQAEATFKPYLSANAKLEGKKLNPEFIHGDWPGNLAMNVDLEFSNQDKQLAFVVNTADIDGRLRERDFSLTSELKWQDQILNLQKFSVRSGESDIHISGKIPMSAENNSGDLNWEANIKNLQDVWPDVKGVLTSSGRVRGSVEEPSLDAKLSLSGLQSYLVDIDQVEASGSFKLVKNNNDISSSPFKFNLDLEELHTNAIHMTTLGVNAGGALNAHSIGVAIQTDKLDFTVALQGALNELKSFAELAQSKWDVVIEESDVAYLDNPSWQLQKPAAGYWSAKSAKIESACWQNPVSQFCLVGEHALAGDSMFQLDVQNIPAEILSAYYPETLTIDTQINGNAAVQLNNGELKRIAIDLTSSEGKLQWNDLYVDQDAQANTQARKELSNDEIILEEGHYTIEYQDVLSANLSLPMQGNQGIIVNVTTTGSGTPLLQQSIDGNVEIDFHEIGFLTEFIPVITDITGHLKGEINVSGLVNDPKFLGNLNLEDGSVTSEEYGIEWKNIKARLNNHADDGIAYTVSLSSGEGELNAKGSTSFELTKFNTELTLSGKNFLLLNNDETRLVVSPDIGITLNNEALRIEGDVIVNNGRFSPKELPKDAVTVSNDQVIVSRKDVVGGDNGIKRYINLNIRIEQSVKVTAFGFKGEINGGFKMRQEPGQATTATGQLQVVNGEYRAYGQGLVVDYGKIIFAGGPIERPGIDIKAHRDPAEGITVGVFVQGYLGNTEFKLFSEPADMSETEQLSWLILGRPLEQNSTEEKNMLADAALSLSLTRADSILKKLSGEVGVDTIGISTGSGEAGAASDNDNAELVLGKYLTPDLFVSYGVGLFNQINTLRIEYIINKNWRIATESNTEQEGGGDIIYSRDKM